MHSQNKSEILRLLWRTKAGSTLTTTEGLQVQILSAGQYDTVTDTFEDADIIVDGERLCGRVSLSTAGFNGTTIAHVTDDPSFVALGADGRPVPALLLAPTAAAAETYETLKRCVDNSVCGKYVCGMDRLRRTSLFTRLLTERLERKCGELNSIFDEAEQNWNETVFVMLLRTMGDSRNKGAFTELAQRLRYSMVSRERNSLLHVEALLLGTSGLLFMYDDDPYTRDLKAAYEYLRRKYSLSPLAAGVWDLGKVHSNNHPVIRMVQMAALLSNREFLLDGIIKCRTVDDLQRLFQTEASDYWTTHSIPGRRTSERPKRIGSMKANLLGINLAVPLIFSYGSYIEDERLKESALDLLEKIGAESNSKTDRWRSCGVLMESAFDSQAILELNNEYCAGKHCWRCPVGREITVRADKHLI